MSAHALRPSSAPPSPAGVASSPIELRHLRYFSAVAEERSFTRAAARLHMAQSPLSAQIRQLEQRLGTTLIDRLPGRLALTATGEALLAVAHATLKTLENGLADVRSVADGRRGHVRVAISPTVPAARAVAAVAVLARKAPDVLVEVVRAHDVEGMLRHQGAHVAFVRDPVGAFLRSLPLVVVAEEPRVVLAPAGHRMTRAPTATLADLARADVLVPPDAMAGLGRPAADVEELLTRVAAGDAVAVVPKSLARDLPHRIHAVDLADVKPSTIVLVGPAGAPAAALAYADAVRAAGPAPDAPLPHA
jgi:DNA-binding transcriptional LysR family regulator